MTTDIELYQPIEAIVADYERQKDIIDAAGVAVGRMNDETSVHIGFTCGGGHNGIDPQTRLKQATWQTIMEKSNCKRFMSTKAQETVTRQLYDTPDTLPEITIEGLNSWLAGLVQSSPDMIQEACREVFEILTPQKGWSDSYKTNEKCREIPASGKVIIKWVCDQDKWVTSPRLLHRGQDRIRALDRVFAMLDGKATPDYPEDSVTKCKAASEAGESKAETPYFVFKMHRNGNLHVTLKRADLVKRLTEYAAGANLAAA